MNKTATQVFRVFATIHNLGKLPRGRTWTCCSQTVTLPYSSNSNLKHNLLNSKAQFLDGGNRIEQAIAKARTSTELLAVMKRNQQLLKSHHWRYAFHMLYHFDKSDNNRGSSKINKIELIQFCELVQQANKHVNVEDAISILRFSNDLQVPSTSIFTQYLLQLINISLSQLSFTSLSKLHQVLVKLKSTPLSEAVGIAAQTLCVNQINNEIINSNDILQLGDALLVLRSKPTNKESIATVINSLRKHGQSMNGSEAVVIFKHLCNLHDLPPGYEDVLSNIEQVLLKSMPLMSDYDITSILRGILKKVDSENKNNFYNEELVDACAKLVVSKDLGFNSGSMILRFLNTLGHTHLRLINYLAVKCFEDPSVLKGNYYNFVRGVTQVDCKPIFWDRIQEIVLKEKNIRNFGRSAMAIRFAVNLAVFDCYDPKLTKKTLTTNVSGRGYSRKLHLNWHWLLFYQSVKTFYPSYTGPWPSKNQLQTAISMSKLITENSNLLPILKNAMGGNQYLLSNLKSKIGHQFDHVVVMRKGGYPVAINLRTEERKDDTHVYIENLELPAGSQVIIILDVPAIAYARNSGSLKGSWSLLIRTIETYTGHTVVPISSVIWNELIDRERIPYLMQAIKQKCNET